MENQENKELDKREYLKEVGKEAAADASWEANEFVKGMLLGDFTWSLLRM